MTKEFWELTHKNLKSLLDLNLADDLPVHTQTAFSTAAIYRSLSGSRDHSRWVCACDARWISSTVDTLEHKSGGYAGGEWRLCVAKKLSEGQEKMILKWKWVIELSDHIKQFSDGYRLSGVQKALQT